MASPDSTGGGGPHFEARVVAYYLAATFAEAPARAVPGLYVTQVLTQRAAFGEPLDDVIVNGILEDGRPTKLSLQVKSTLTFTENDKEWISVLKQAWATFTSGTFDPALDRLGVAINSYHARADKYYQSVLSWAAHSSTGQDFMQRITRKDFSHKDQRAFVAVTRKILSSHAAERPSTMKPSGGSSACFASSTSISIPKTHRVTRQALWTAFAIAYHLISEVRQPPSGRIWLQRLV